MSEEFFLSPLGQFLFAFAWTAVAALAAWWGLSVVVPGYRKGQFRYLFRTFSRTERPFAFRYHLYCMTVWTGLACLFVPIGLAFIANAFVRLF